MKTKAIIMKRGHKNGVVQLTKKKLQENPSFFRYQNNIYFIHEDYFQLTKARRWHGFRVNYITYYYPEGKPWPMAPQGETGYREVETANGKEMALLPHAVPDIDNHENHLDASDADTIFASWVVKTIAPMPQPVLERVGFMLQVATACGVGFLIWQVMQLPEKMAMAAGLIPGT